MLDLFFLTSSRVKLDHIRYLLRDYAIHIRPPIDYGKPYEEPRIYDREKLLAESMEDANRRLGRNTVASTHKGTNLIDDVSIEDYAHLHQERPFIIEDTSIIIEALSDEEEYPGLDAKYWMKETSFETIDKELRAKGNNRNVIVRSDIVLYLPRRIRTGQHFLQFTGTTKGVISDKECFFSTNPMYPWLDNKTFNKWFVPGNEDIPISCLPIKIATKYDFRHKAIEKLVSYLQDKHILAIKQSESFKRPSQTSFFDPPNIILCGPSCSGKSLLATHLSRAYDYYHIEASDFMYLSFYKKHGFKSSLSIHDFALQALEDDPNIVASQIIKHIEENIDSPVVVTGFRSPDELNHFLKSKGDYIYCYIDANAELRHKRCLLRGRTDKTQTLSDFLARDEKQNKMGLFSIREMLEFDLLTNESSIRSYFKQFEEKYLTNYEKHISAKAFEIINRLKPGISLEQAILIALLMDCAKHNTYRTTTEIAKIINDRLIDYRARSGQSIVTNKNNVSRYFNQRNYPYYEVQHLSGTTRFRISTTGASYTLNMLRKLTA